MKWNFWLEGKCIFVNICIFININSSCVTLSSSPLLFTHNSHPTYFQDFCTGEFRKSCSWGAVYLHLSHISTSILVLARTSVYKWSLTQNCLTFDFWTFWWHKSNTHSVETTLNFELEFWILILSQANNMYCAVLVSCLQRQWAKLLVSYELPKPPNTSLSSKFSGGLFCSVVG